MGRILLPGMVPHEVPEDPGPLDVLVLPEGKGVSMVSSAGNNLKNTSCRRSLDPSYIINLHIFYKEFQ